MKLKYYLKGMGVGIIVTTLILTISFQNRNSMSDSEIKEKAKELGMVETYEEGVLSDLQKEISDVASEDGTAGTESMDSEEASEDSAMSEDSAIESETNENTDMEEMSALSESVSGDNVVSGNYVVSEDGAYMMVTVWEGEYASAVAKRLEALGLIEDAKSFARYLVDTGHEYFVRYGVHKVPVGVDDETVAKILISSS